MPVRGVWLALTLAAVLPAWSVGLADNKPADPGADLEFLEFLGSVDAGADAQTAADEGRWIDYLSQTDPSKVAQNDPRGSHQARQAAQAAPPPAAGDKKDE